VGGLNSASSVGAGTDSEVVGAGSVVSVVAVGAGASPFVIGLSLFLGNKLAKILCRLFLTSGAVVG